VPATLAPVFESDSCKGRHLVLSCRDAARPPAGQIGLELATLLAEREAKTRGKRRTHPVVTLLVRRDEDASASGWVAAALPWLSRHGRRVILRTRKVLDRGLVESAVEHGATIELELAHHKAALQSALLGPGAEPAAALLLHAQYLENVGLVVVARLAPMMPGIHDEDRTFEVLVRNVLAADVVDGHVEVGRLHGPQIDDLLHTPRILPPGTLLRLGRAYGLSPQELLTRNTQGPWSLRDQPARGLRRALETIARDHGLRVDACGCPAQCHLDARERDYQAIDAPDLFLGRVG
jgi:hypothetical protein